MKLSEIRAWVGKACIITWTDSGSWDSDTVDYKKMRLSRTPTTGLLVFVGKNDDGDMIAILEHERESPEFGRANHSVIYVKCIKEISNKRRS